MIKVNRGYAGFYKGHYLRSSYEYAYAKYLDYFSIHWRYEEKVFDLGYKMYKPDFFLYDKDNRLQKIVEIKSRNKEAKNNARNSLNTIEEKFNIKCELISYEELLKLYKELPFSLTSTINEWITSSNTTINKAAYGELNGHYNLKHNNDSKRKIGEHTKKLWASDGTAKQRMLEGLRNSGLAQKGKLKKRRQTRFCLECKKKFIVIETSPQKFCSQSCAGKDAIKRATDIYVGKRKEIHDDIKEYIIQWSNDHREIVLATPLNRIKTTIKPLLKDIEKLFDVKDMRVISKAVFGEDQGRKELIKFMQNVCNEKVC
ncbi:restriction endonuclease [Neobacillus novalis]|uniref:restriction endonuclease n=1 Tax=Neobacillus novalis TaxID=220687 RepID=UPI000A3F40A4